MGSGSSVNKITFDLYQENSFYFTDQIISGIVNWNNDADNIRVKEIYILFQGEIGYTTTRTVREKGGGTRRQTQYHHIPFYSSKVSFIKPQLQEEPLVLNREQYSWPFQFSLTNHLPPTVNLPQSYPHVRYYLQVVIDRRPWYKPNIRELRYLTIYPHVNLLANPQCLQSTIFGNHNRKEITIKGIINKTGYIPGESISLTLEIENPKQVSIRLIDLLIFQSYEIGATACRHNIFQTTLPNIQDLKDREIRGACSVTIPFTLLPPSYHFQGGLQRTGLANIHYFMKLAVKVEGMFTNFEVDIPIIIGTEPGSYQNQQLNSNPQMVPHSSNDNQPPSYDCVVEDKK